jgi:hypothetical protein
MGSGLNLAGWRTGSGGGKNFSMMACSAGIMLLNLAPHKSFGRSPGVGAHLCSRSATGPHASSTTGPHPSAGAATAPPTPPVGHPLQSCSTRRPSLAAHSPPPRCFSLSKVSYSVPPSSFVKITVIGCWMCECDGVPCHCRMSMCVALPWVDLHAGWICSLSLTPSYNCSIMLEAEQIFC